MKRRKIALVTLAAALLVVTAGPVMARRVRCDNCRGTGVVPCFNCGGRGEVLAKHQTRPGSKQGPVYEDCPVCPDWKGIRGQLACRVCGGAGSQEVPDDQNFNYNFNFN
jgi:DnaJ-class molecular chaperone